MSKRTFDDKIVPGDDWYPTNQKFKAKLISFISSREIFQAKKVTYQESVHGEYDRMIM